MRLSTALVCLVALAAVCLVAGERVGGAAELAKSTEFETKNAKISVNVEPLEEEKKEEAVKEEEKKEEKKEEEKQEEKKEEGGNGAVINLNLGDEKKEEQKEEGCTDNCEAGENAENKVAGPEHMSEPLGDLDSGYAPVAGSQTEANPTPYMTMPLDQGLDESPVAGIAPKPEGSVMDSPIVSVGAPPPPISKSPIEQLKDAATASTARREIQKKANLHNEMAAAQDQLQYSNKLQRELRYQYSELQVKHAQLRGEVQAAQLELAKLNKESAAFRGSEDDIGLPLRPLADLEQKTPKDELGMNSDDPHKRIESLLQAILDRMDEKKEGEKEDTAKADEEKEKAEKAKEEAEKAEEKEKEADEKKKKEEAFKSRLPAGFQSKIPIPHSEIKAEQEAAEAKRLAQEA